LMKAFKLLEAFREHPNGLTQSELEKGYPGVSRVSIFRILHSLESVSYLEKRPLPPKKFSVANWNGSGNRATRLTIRKM